MSVTWNTFHTICFCAILGWHGAEGGRYSSPGELTLKLIVPLIIVALILIAMLSLLAFFYLRKNNRAVCSCSCCQRLHTDVSTVLPPGGNQYNFTAGHPEFPMTECQVVLPLVDTGSPSVEYKVLNCMQRECRCQEMLEKMEAEERQGKQVTQYECPCCVQRGNALSVEFEKIPHLLPPLPSQKR